MGYFLRSFCWGVMKKFTAWIIALLFVVISIAPALADLPYLTVTGNPVTAPSAPFLVLTGLSGQPGCSVSVSGTFAGSLSIEGFYKNGSAWTSALTVVSPDGTTSQTSITVAGNYAFNCGTMVSVRADATSATGNPIVVLNASQGINRVLGAGVNGGRTIVNGTTPVIVSNSGNTATVAISPLPIPLLYGGTGATALPSGCLQSNGAIVSSTGSACAGAATPVSVQAGTGTGVATPSPGVFVVSNTGVTSVAGAGNISSSGGQTPTVSITDAPTFGQITVSGLTVGRCVQTTTGGLLTVAAAACGTGSGTVTSVTGSGNIASSGGITPNVTITNAPTFTGTATVGNLADSGLSVSTCVGADTAAVLKSSTNCIASVGVGSNIINTGTATAPVIALTSVPQTLAYKAINAGGGYALTAGAGGYGNTVGCTGACDQPTAYLWTTSVGAGIGGFIGGDGAAGNIQGVTRSYIQFGVNNNGTASVHAAIDPTTGNVGTDGTITSGTLTASSCVGTNGSKTLVNAVCPTARSGGTLLGGIHIETVPSTSVAGTSTNTFNFGATYAVAPSCTVATINASTSVTPAFNISSISTTQLVVVNTNNTSQNYEAICVGF